MKFARRQFNGHTGRHGGPEDRGHCDRFYNRLYDPHYYTDRTYQSPRIGKDDMTPRQITLYKRGFDNCAERKDW